MNVRKGQKEKRTAKEEDPLFSLCFRESGLFIALTNMTSLFWFLLVSKPFLPIIFPLFKDRKKKSLHN